jgi:serine protease Do
MPCCPFIRIRMFATLLLAALAPAMILHSALRARGEDVDRKVLDLEAQRVAAIEKVQPTVVAIFSAGGQQAGQGGGSGVLISKDGYALTNFHVVQGAGPVMFCGLPDGVLYDAVLVGLDKVGDVALIKLLPKEKGKDFPFAVMGDSDTVHAGDWSMALGNPFLLATDFKPTVTYGLVSGIHRYQYPSGTLLEYTDCIQVDTSINPGNSGGPLFNMKGELIGVNGRGSFDKRGRVNSGVGYAISINQIKNFLGHLRAGIDTDHATLGAAVESEAEEGDDEGGTRLLVRSLIENSDIHRRGLDVDDELVSFAGRPVTSVNQFKNALGLYPKGWRVPLVYRRTQVKREILARLMQLHTQEQLAQMRARQPQQQQQPIPNTPAAKLYDPQPGYANYYFNKVERDRLMADLAKLGDFVKVAGAWTLQADADLKQRRSDLQIVIREEEDTGGASGKPVVREWTYHLNPKNLPSLPEEDAKEDKTPLRQAVRQALELLGKHAQAFPQEIFAKESEAQTKEYAAQLQKNLAPKQQELKSALEALKQAEKERGKESSRLWQAQLDYAQARLSAFVAYVAEYQHLLGQLAGKDGPPRDPRKHRGWRMVPDEKIQDADAQKFANEANRIWQKMIKDYNDTVWEDRAQDGRKTLVGLKWQPAGGTRTVVGLSSLTLAYKLDPLKVGQDLQVLKDPPGSGGLLLALYQYRRLLTLGQPGFEGHFTHGGHAPIYPTPPDPAHAKGYKDWRVDAEVLLTEHAAVPAKWYFSLKDHTLLGFEVYVDADEDPCEVYLSDYRSVDGRLLPHRFEVRHGNETFGTLTVKSYQLAPAQ